MKERLDVRHLSILAAITIAITALSFAAYYASTDASSSKDALFKWSFAVSNAIVLLIWIAISLAISNKRPELRALRRSRLSVRAAVGLGLLSVAGLFVASIIVTTLGGRPGEEQGLLNEHWRSGRLAPFVASILVLTVLTPFAEELFVRGLGIGLVQPLGLVATLTVPALAWELMHGIPSAIFPLFVFGIGLAYLRERSDSVVPVMIVHGLYNGLALALAFTT